MANAAQLPRRFAFCPVLAFFLGALLFVSCGKPAGAPKSQATATTNSAPPVAGPGPGEKVCFACDGAGMVKCPAPGCVNGQVPCPGPCLKLSKGIWRHTDIDGKPSDVLWQIFNSPDGRGDFRRQRTSSWRSPRLSRRPIPTKRQVPDLRWHRQGEMRCLQGNGQSHLSDLRG